MPVTDPLLAILIIVVCCTMIQQAAYHRALIQELRRARSQPDSAERQT